MKRKSLMKKKSLGLKILLHESGNDFRPIRGAGGCDVYNGAPHRIFSEDRARDLLQTERFYQNLIMRNIEIELERKK